MPVAKADSVHANSQFSHENLAKSVVLWYIFYPGVTVQKLATLSNYCTKSDISHHIGFNVKLFGWVLNMVKLFGGLIYN